MWKGETSFFGPIPNGPEPVMIKIKLDNKVNRWCFLKNWATINKDKQDTGNRKERSSHVLSLVMETIYHQLEESRCHGNRASLSCAAWMILHPDIRHCYFQETANIVSVFSIFPRWSDGCQVSLPVRMPVRWMTLCPVLSGRTSASSGAVNWILCRCRACVEAKSLLLLSGLWFYSLQTFDCLIVSVLNSN